MNIVTRPFKWISAHREAKFVFEYEHNYLVLFVAELNGKAIFTFDYDGINNLEVGDYFYINSGVYKGYHKVKEIVTAFQYVSETDYISAASGMQMYFIEDHVFKIAAGYDYGTLADYLEYKDVALFKPEPNADGQLVVNISGYVNKLFDVINSNDTVVVGAYPVYYNLFNRVQLFIDDVLVSEHLAANSAIDMFELNSTYVDTGRDLNGGNLGNHYLSCGESDSVQIVGDYIVRKNTYVAGGIVPKVADFDSNDFNASDFGTVGG